MVDYDSGVMGFIGAFGMPIVLLVIVAFVIWDRRRHRQRSEPVADGPPDETYTVYTREFDLELTADRIPTALKEASLDFFEGWTDRDGIGWRRHREDAAKRAADQPTPEAAADAIRAQTGSLAGTVVTFLVDQSGSMKDGLMAAVAAALVPVDEAVRSLGASSEILGFSTAGWRGGRAAYSWKWAAGPKRPGRLCATLHIIYKSPDESEWPQPSRDAMLHPDIMRENVDGEALEWAAGRLAGLPARRRLLVMISDGAPVDDATLLSNGISYLSRHLAVVAQAIEARPDMTLGALGIGDATGRYFANYRYAQPDDIAAELIALIGDLALHSDPATAPASLGE